MAYGGSKANGNYYKPVFTTIKLEAIWTVKVSYARFAGKIIKGLLKSLASVSKQEYKPTGGAISSGYHAQLVYFSMVPMIDEPCSYPDW